MKVSKIIFAFFLSILLFFSFNSIGLAETEEEKQLKELQEKIEEYQRKIDELQGEQQTLSSTINYLDSKVSLTTTQIAKTEQQLKILIEEIAKLLVKIDVLDKSLVDVSNIFSNRVKEIYKRNLTNPLYFLFSSHGLTEFLSRIQYLRIAQRHDQELLFQMQESKLNYDAQKKLKEEKQAEEEELKKQLESQKVVLAQQKQSKQELLEVTKNDEQTYQKLVSEAEREIASLLASKFTGKRHVGEGEVIGLMGNTGFSTGPHLHFGVYNLAESDADNFDYYADAGDPFNYLTSRSAVFLDNSCDDVPSEQTKTIGGGSWRWPMDNFYVTQCYGHTPYSWRYSNNFHNGIDIASTSNLSIRAVREGEAYFYRGDSSMGNNVRVFHPDGKMTLYLHLQ